MDPAKSALEVTELKPFTEHQIVYRRKVKDEMRMVIEWRSTGASECTNTGEGSAILSHFEGVGPVMQTDGQRQWVQTIQFPIGNVKSLDEAFAAYDEAKELHVKVMNARHAHIHAQQMQQQQAMQRQHEIQKAVHGIVLAR